MTLSLTLYRDSLTLIYFLLQNLVHFAESTNALYDHCDNDSVQSSISASSLTLNEVHKVCPPVLPQSELLGQPICGNGDAFSFLYTSPSQANVEEDKIVIEFMGGGACWNEATCNGAGDVLKFPTYFDPFIGISCNVVSLTSSNHVCTKKIGDLDFTEYSTIIVPYCTQDVHMGDNNTVYGVHHHGAHNIVSVFNWVYKNFPNPSHIALTGCSAGGTALPLAYELLNKHYNAIFKGGRTVNINVISDSPVFLTPEEFLVNEIDNWNPWTVLEKIRFKYEKWRYEATFSRELYEHVLRRGSNHDRWGVLSHTSDGVSQSFFSAMGGIHGTWESEFKGSLETIMEDFDNFNVYYIDGNGHCEFGLSEGLRQDGFEEWMQDIFTEQLNTRQCK